MILLSVLNQLALMQRLYENNDVSLVEVRHAVILASTTLKDELIQNAQTYGPLPVLHATTNAEALAQLDLILDANAMAVLCCYPEDLLRIQSFLETTTTELLERHQPSVKVVETPLEEISAEELDEVHILSEAEVSELFERVSTIAPNNDRLAWKRLYKELQRHLIEYKDINDNYLEMKAKRLTLNKTISEMREKMVNECVHPKTELVYKGDHVVCKFCEKRLKLTS